MSKQKPRAKDEFIPIPEEAVDGTIEDMFARQVLLVPDRIAINGRTQTLTYSFLDCEARKIGRALVLECGDAVEPVGLLFEHDAQAILAIMGILKTAKFYVPLDPSNPAERQRHILDDSGARLILTNDRNEALARELAGPGRQVLNVDDLERSGLVNDGTESLVARRSPDHIVSLAYTSGSTGRPKAVIRSERVVLHQAREYINDSSIGVVDRVSLINSYTLGAATRGIFGALLSGASLFPLDLKVVALADFADWLTRESITIFHCNPPTVLRHLDGIIPSDHIFPTIRVLRLAGEKVLSGDFDIYERHFREDSELIVGYSTTESGSISNVHIYKRSVRDRNASTVGFPTNGIEILILDDDGNRVQRGEKGEIAVRSRFLSPGYWRMPDLNREKFLPEPEGGDSRIYLTGDLGRLLPDGSLIHMGRLDTMVKIRGNRVELTEIERVLSTHEGVRDCAVATKDDPSGNPRLIAYIVARNMAPSVGDLRNRLKKSLPIHMMPSAFIFMDRLPQGPSGKLDRGALPEPSQSMFKNHDAPIVLPRTPVEQQIAEIWSEVLDLDEVSVTEDFLELGGHSLQASQIVSRVEKRLHIQVPLQSLLEAATIADMALAVTLEHARGVGEGELGRFLTKLESQPDLD